MDITSRPPVPAEAPLADLIDFTPADSGWVSTELRTDLGSGVYDILPIIGWATYRVTDGGETFTDVRPITFSMDLTYYTDLPNPHVYYARKLFMESQSGHLTMSLAQLRAAVLDRA